VNLYYQKKQIGRFGEILSNDQILEIQAGLGERLLDEEKIQEFLTNLKKISEKEPEICEEMKESLCETGKHGVILLKKIQELWEDREKLKGVLLQNEEGRVKLSNEIET